VPADPAFAAACFDTGATIGAGGGGLCSGIDFPIRIISFTTYVTLNHCGHK